MTRIVLLALLLATGGAIVNVAVASVAPRGQVYVEVASSPPFSGSCYLSQRAGLPLRIFEHNPFSGTIPREIIWPGFAINTVFYAGFLWLMFAAPFALRRRVREGRIKRGLCPACAYPVGESPVCTECGKAVTLR